MIALSAMICNLFRYSKARRDFPEKHYSSARVRYVTVRSTITLKKKGSLLFRVANIKRILIILVFDGNIYLPDLGIFLEPPSPGRKENSEDGVNERLAGIHLSKKLFR